MKLLLEWEVQWGKRVHCMTWKSTRATVSKTVARTMPSQVRSVFNDFCTMHNTGTQDGSGNVLEQEPFTIHTNRSAISASIPRRMSSTVCLRREETLQCIKEKMGKVWCPRTGAVQLSHPDLRNLSSHYFWDVNNCLSKSKSSSRIPTFKEERS